MVRRWNSCANFVWIYEIGIVEKPIHFGGACVKPERELRFPSGCAEIYERSDFLRLG
jgi:hypothetical protein